MKRPALIETYLVGIGHRARHGKDTVGWKLMDDLRSWGINARVYGFAESLRCYARLTERMYEKNPAILQEMGDRLRDGNVDIFIDTLWWKIHEDHVRVAIITDLRYPNEAVAIEAAGGLTVHVDRGDYSATDRPLDHPTETALKKWNFQHRVVNLGTLADLDPEVRLLSRIVTNKLERRHAMEE